MARFTMHVNIGLNGINCSQTVEFRSTDTVGFIESELAKWAAEECRLVMEALDKIDLPGVHRGAPTGGITAFVEKTSYYVAVKER